MRKLNYSQLKELLEAGVVDVNARDQNGNTALHIPYLEALVLHPVIEQEPLDTLMLVLEHGADPKIENDLGKSLYSDYQDFFGNYHGDRAESYLAMAHLAVKLFGVNGKDGYGETALNHALLWGSYGGEIELARDLVAKGADVRTLSNLKDYDAIANTTLEAAAVLVMDRDEFVSLLFEQEEGIVNTLTQQGEHLLSLAKEWGNQVVVDTLHEYGVGK